MSTASPRRGRGNPLAGPEDATLTRSSSQHCDCFTEVALNLESRQCLSCMKASFLKGEEKRRSGCGVKESAHLYAHIV